MQGSLLGSLPQSQAEGANSLPQVWHSIGPRLASLARFRDPSEATFALFGNLRHSSGSVFAHLRIPIGHYRDAAGKWGQFVPTSNSNGQPDRPATDAMIRARIECLSCLVY